MDSASIANTPPAANARMMAGSAGEVVFSKRYPAAAAIPLISRIPVQSA
jgi:hypothetical protein